MKFNVNEDLQRERLKCNFNTEELIIFLDGGAQNTEYRRKLEKKVLSVPGILDEIPEEYLGYKEKYENAIRKATLLYRALQQNEDSSLNEDDKIIITFRSSIINAVFRDYTPFGVHFTMFIPTLRNQADEKQKEYWLKRALNLEIIGTYAQTELGHGTFIRGLETKAIYDSNTEEFILNSPTLTSYKWWPGHLGQTSNYCVVMAHLYITGKSCGIQPFLVQIRDEETHMPLPGIKVGEIGAKLGFNTANNGFLGFDHVRIPREWMLMKNAQVMKDGTFKASSNNKLTYGTMVYVRVMIVNSTANTLARAVTIAIRYAAVRRQSNPKSNEPESQILDYLTQQHKLFIGIATSYAYIIFARWLWGMYSTTTKALSSGNLDNLPELHAVACVMKVLSSSDCTALVEQCRLACGGHGYILSSNFPQLYGTATATCTYEGENTVLLLQTARYLYKVWNWKGKGLPLSPSTAYLAEQRQEQWDCSLDGIIRSFQSVSFGKLSTSVSSLEQYVKSGLSAEDAWNKASVQFIAAAEAHGRAILLAIYKSEMDRKVSSLSVPLKTVLMTIVEMYFVYWSLQKTGDLLLKGMIIIQLKNHDIQFEYRGDVLNPLLPYISQDGYGTDAVPASVVPLNSISIKTYLRVILQKYQDHESSEAPYTQISGEDIRTLQRRYEDLLEKIRPNAVGLVDSFDFRDEVLYSTLGAYDGRVYERLMEEAMKSPLNKEPVNDSFHKYLKPFMQRKL